ncbi:MAG: hypothetical protein ABI633_02605 [Burkholderiales bacterium]
MNLKTPDHNDLANRDPITDAPGAHPLGVGIGAAVGGVAAGVATAAATGAAVGTAAGPVGTIVGAAVGAVVGGLAGKAVAEHYDPTVEDAYWRDQYDKEPYYSRELTFDDYSPAYRYGGEARGRYAGRSFDDVEPELGREWDRARGKSRMTWAQASPAARASWTRLTR